MPTCVRCLVDRGEDAFSKRERGRRRSDCKLCVAARVRSQLASPEDRAVFNAKSRAYYARRDAAKLAAAEARRFSNFYLTINGALFPFANPQTYGVG